MKRRIPSSLTPQKKAVKRSPGRSIKAEEDSILNQAPSATNVPAGRTRVKRTALKLERAPEDEDKLRACTSEEMLGISDEQLLQESLSVLQQRDPAAEPTLRYADGEGSGSKPYVVPAHSTVVLELPPEVLAFKEAKRQQLAQGTASLELEPSANAMLAMETQLAGAVSLKSSTLEKPEEPREVLPPAHQSAHTEAAMEAVIQPSGLSQGTLLAKMLAAGSDSD